ncbi:hypothetical protein EDB89DRAFT_1499235 [Lactarius sanguifluus]|nr:hypothetical protein EDB89DRAFT_1499235 [Lactarius sanguifluus]
MSYIFLRRLHFLANSSLVLPNQTRCRSVPVSRLAQRTVRRWNCQYLEYSKCALSLLSPTTPHCERPLHTNGASLLASNSARLTSLLQCSSASGIVYPVPAKRLVS